VKLADPDGFVRMVRAVFTQRRKTIGNALKTFAAESDTQPAGLLKAAGIDARRRPETLDLKEFATLSNAISGPRENG
jgi:16S rRNA (adenine1518-N6/adenine1519-N6)-dimethyltransferase